VYTFSEDVILPIRNETSVAPSDEIRKGTKVIALYPNSSCFYNATVWGSPNGYDGENYVIIFDDDNGFERYVPQGMVLEVPDHLSGLMD
jgi:hypothetical protein